MGGRLEIGVSSFVYCSTFSLGGKFQSGIGGSMRGRCGNIGFRI